MKFHRRSTGLAIVSMVVIAPTLIFARSGFAQIPVLELSLPDAESRALSGSDQLKASVSDKEAADEQKGAALVGLLPKLSIQGNYQYNTAVPTISFGPMSVPFGINSTYNIGAVLSYNLWDTLSAWKSYRSASLSNDARGEDLRNSRLLTLEGIRSAYFQVRLAIEELELIQGSLELAQAQDRDIANRFRAGAASHLDVVTSGRSVLSYELQFEQRQSQLSLALKDFLALVGENRSAEELAHPAPPGINRGSLIVKFDSLQKLLSDEASAASAVLDSHHQPQLQSLQLQSEALEYAASSQKARVFPTVQVSGAVAWMLPNAPLTGTPYANGFNQNTFTVSLNAPLWLGDPTWRQAEQTLRQAEASRHRADQLKINLERDFSKARELLASLREQRRLATQDVSQSEEAARLYYSSYKAGKNNLIDVQSANTQALQAKVTAARLDAQILTQLITIKALAAEEVGHD